MSTDNPHCLRPRGRDTPDPQVFFAYYLHTCEYLITCRKCARIVRLSYLHCMFLCATCVYLLQVVCTPFFIFGLFAFITFVCTTTCVSLCALIVPDQTHTSAAIHACFECSHDACTLCLTDVSTCMSVCCGDRTCERERGKRDK